jgi:neutral ceramidase
MQVSRLLAGVAETELKPALGLATGDGAPWAKGFKMPLACKALVLANAESAVALIALDALGIDLADGRRIAELVAARTRVPASGVSIICSHTHVAPSMETSLHTYRRHRNPDFDEAAAAREREWVAELTETIVATVERAEAGLQEASIGRESLDLPWLIFNRRRYTRDFGVMTHWMRIPAGQAYLQEGPIDPECGVLLVRDAAHRPMCLLWNMSGHNSFSFGDQYAGDLTYTVQAALDTMLGEHIPCLYAAGCSGDTNFFDYHHDYGLDKATEGVASAIAATFREIGTQPDVAIGSRKTELHFAQRDFSRYWWKDDVSWKFPVYTDYGLEEVERFRREAAESPTYASDVTAFRIGDVAFVSLPGEMFVEFGLMLKERSPFPHTFVATYANDYAGYVTTRKAYAGGSYETWPVLNARIGREGGYAMIDKAVELLEDLRRA